MGEQGGKPDFISFLVAHVRCAVCGEGYRAEDVRILGRQDELWVVAVSCAGCRTESIVFALVRGGEAADQGAISELTAEERERFQSLPEIGLREVLALHKLLEGFQGDMKDLVGEGDGPLGSLYGPL